MSATPSGLPSWAKVGPKRRGHIERVAALLTAWADTMAMALPERSRWLKAAWLHDAMRDAEPDELRRWAPDAEGPESFWHGPAAAARAASAGETDAGVLDAVRYHTTGLAEWDHVGRALYCADFLEPGRRFDPEIRAALAARFPAEPTRVLTEVASRRLQHVIRSGWPIPEATRRFWNALVADAGSAFR